MMGFCKSGRPGDSICNDPIAIVQQTRTCQLRFARTTELTIIAMRSLVDTGFPSRWFQEIARKGDWSSALRGASKSDLLGIRRNEPQRAQGAPRKEQGGI